jgi:hypothetical protein
MKKSRPNTAPARRASVISGRVKLDHKNKPGIGESG